MKKNVTTVLAICSAAALLIFLFLYSGFETSEEKPSAESLLAAVEQSFPDEEGGMKEARSEYFFQLLRDPATNAIPEDIRSREVNFARMLPTADQVRRGKGLEGAMTNHYDWTLAGPTDVGGRTRALGIDQRNANILISGGVSGGIWKSIDAGITWDMKTPAVENLSVTDLVQDPNNPDTWYYVSGELTGNSASSGGAFYYGSGVFRSDDNGENWTLITPNDDSIQFLDDPFDILSRVVVSPTSGSVFVCSNGYGVYRSTDGTTFENTALIGTEVSQAHCDIAVTPDGTLYVALSTEIIVNNGNTPQDTGVFMSTDDGDTWTDITPPLTYPTEHGRSVLTYAPSDPDIVYVLTENFESNDHQGVAFHMIDIAQGLSEDRSEHLPDFRIDGNGSGWMNLQGGYNMMVAVKPDDPNFVMVGGINLFRSTDGFATSPSGGYDGNNESQKDEYWIGGYNHSVDNPFGLYPDHHPDLHIQAFDPNNPDRMWSGHDGGVSVTDNITAEPVDWTDRNEGYITSQFYTSAIAAEAGDNRLMGGTQDNGTPFFRYPAGENLIPSQDISSGDGAYSFFTQDYFFVSRQRGSVIRYNRSSTGEIAAPFAFIHPNGVDSQNLLFIHPYEIDPNDQSILYYPEGNRLWRNTQVDEITNQDADGTSFGWGRMNNASLTAGYTITALDVSESPGNILYYGGFATDSPPELKRLPNASTSSAAPEDISIDAAPDGAFLKDIAINPVNSSELIAVYSNYNITGLYHTTDAGDTWTAIEGNLTGTNADPGPSLRSAAIVPSEQGQIYILGTSTGLYRTDVLDGNNTVWGQEAIGTVGFAVTSYLDARISDGNIAAATHGRGMYLGEFQGVVDAPFITASPTEARPGATVTITANDFEFNPNPDENEVRFDQIDAEVVSATESELQVVVPRDVVEPTAASNSVIITVSTGGQTITTTFDVLPPAGFALDQNYPNPFNGTATIPLDLAGDSRVTLVIYDIMGREIDRPLHDDTFNAGAYDIPVDLTRFASGTYMYRVTAEPTGTGGETFVQSEKMTLIK